MTTERDGDRIGKAWREYRLLAIPITAPAVQATECRRAFYAGAGALLTAVLAMLGPGEEPTQDELRAMDEINAELHAFVAAVREGRA